MTTFLARPQEQKSIVAMEGIMEALGKSGSLFEVPVPDYKQLKACRKEVCLLKELWDMIVMVRQGQGQGQGRGRGTQGREGTLAPAGRRARPVSFGCRRAPAGFLVREGGTDRTPGWVP